MVCRDNGNCKENLSWQQKNEIWQGIWRRWERTFESGYNVVPAVAGTKIPLIPWKRFQTERLDQEELWEWERKYKTPFSCNMLIVTGDTPDAKCVVIDSDDEEAEEVVASHCPETPFKVKTTRGWHRYYRHPGYRVKQVLGHTINGKLYKIDVKADGNYVVAPGSISDKGHHYEEWSEITPELLAECPVYDPSWLPNERPTPDVEESDCDYSNLDHDGFVSRDDLPPLSDRLERARAYVEGTPGTQGKGASNACLRLASKLVWGFALPFKEALRLLMDHWARRPDQRDELGGYYPWEEEEIIHKLQSVIDRPEGYPGTPGDKLSPTEADLDARLYREFEAIAHTIPSLAPWIDPDFERTPDEDDRYQTAQTLDPNEEILDIFATKARAESIKREWIADKWIQNGHCIVLSGREKRGKSTLVDDLITGILTEQRWLDYIPTRRVPVLLLDYENPVDYVWYNLEKMLSERGADLAEINPYFGMIDPDLIRNVASPIVIDYAKSRISHMERKSGGKGGLLVIDTAMPAFLKMFDDPNWTNNNTSVRQALEVGQQIARETGWAVLIIYHDNKSGTGAAGSYEWYATPDVFMRFERELEDPKGYLSIYGRLMEPPKPLEVTRMGGLLHAVPKGEIQATRAALKEQDRYYLFRGMIPYGEDRAIKQTDLIAAARAKGCPKTEAELFAKRVGHDGAIRSKRGAKNALYYWRDADGIMGDSGNLGDSQSVSYDDSPDLM